MPPRESLIAALLVVVGIALLANPYYLWPHHGDDDYAVAAGEVTVVGDDATPIEELPPETARFVEQLIERDGPQVFEDRDAIPADVRSPIGGPVVASGGSEYRITVDRVDRSPPLLPEHWVVRAGTGLAGSLALALGAVTAVRGSPRLTPRLAWSVVGIWTTVLLGTIAYDGGGHGLGLADPVVPVASTVAVGGVPLVGAAALSLPAVGVVVGAAIRGRRWRDGPDRGTVLAVAFVAGTAFVSLPGVLAGWLLGTDPE